MKKKKKKKKKKTFPKSWQRSVQADLPAIGYDVALDDLAR